MGRASKAAARKRPPAAAVRSQRRVSARAEKLEPLLEELCNVVEAVGVQVRRERLLREVGYHTQSGLCRLGEQEILLIEHELDPDLQLELLLGTLSGRDLSGVPLSEQARRLLGH